MTGPSLAQRQHAARLLHELGRAATAAIIGQMPRRPGVTAPTVTVHRRSGLSAKEFWRTVNRLAALGVLHQNAAGLMIDHDQLDGVAGTLVADSPFNSIMVSHRRLKPFVQWGRITRMPTTTGLIEELYEALGCLFESGEILDEGIVNARIAAVHDDPAEVRRALVNRELLMRSPGSRTYVRPY